MCPVVFAFSAVFCFCVVLETMAIGSTNVHFLNLSTSEGASSTYGQRVGDDSSRPKVLIFGTRDEFLEDSRKKNIVREFIDVTSFSVLNEDISNLIFSMFPMLAGKETSLSSRTSGGSYLIHQRPTITSSDNYLMQLRATKTSRDNYLRQHRSTIASADSYLVSHRRYEVEDFTSRASPDNNKNTVNKQNSEKVPKFVNGKYHKVLEGVNLLKLANSPNNDLTDFYFQGASRHLIKRDSGLITEYCGPVGRRCQHLETWRCTNMCVNGRRNTTVCKFQYRRNAVTHVVCMVCA